MRPPGPLEIGLVVLIILIVFGVGKLPQVTEFVGKSTGKVVSLFRRKKGEEADDDSSQKVAKKKKKVIKELDQ
ncbi:MAG: twin-arginine translocase TatA/TatE family subunit [Dehalococcoidales bacterium]|nr:twin-arginine translocase TatA/TatE family subunit [Dehalococcoidales bacterium]